jgi:hypothetical protein
MKIISWNCRGLGNPQIVRDLCQMVKEKRPSVLFLMETKCRQHKMEGIRVKLGFEGLFVVDPVGRSGGLALLWSESVGLEIQNFTRRHINAVINLPGRDAPWKLTCFYGHPDSSKRHESWALLKHLHSFIPEAWLCIGDFNEVVEQAEKVGGNLRRESQMDHFRVALEECSLSDLGYIGSKYTWTNCHQDGTFMKERLDRAIANKEWCELFANYEVRVLAARTSDHKPLLLTMADTYDSHIRYHKSFKFEASWLEDRECLDVIKEAWELGADGGVGMQSTRLRLAQCQTSLVRWSTRKYGDVEKRLKEKTKQLDLMQQHEGEENWGEITALQRDINLILEQEDAKWKQRAKQHWFQRGDRNTPFFHAWANHRRRINRLVKIKDEEGREWKKQHEIGHAFTRFFQGLFSAGEVSGTDVCLAGLEPKVSDEMNRSLLREFTMGEVEAALNHMGPLKSPGPDGFSACFYQNSWPTVKVEVCQAVLGFLNHDIFDVDLNSTHIALVPKIKNPSRVTDYRPISLCNVLYKLISKVLANRLKKVLPLIISPTQSAFVPGRLITDNILVAFEAMHTMDRKMTGREGYMALKLDMSKAYDRVEWSFLEEVMRKLGFASRWIQLTMICVKTVTYSVLIHGKPYGKIVPTRGIRQGDPLSPYLFIMCAEGLSSLLQKAESERWITGLPITRGGMRLNHLFFADDSLLFCKANIFEWLRIQQVLEIYENASGQKLNRDKTSIFFSRNTRREAKEHITSIAGVSSTRRYEKYLGLPALVGRSRIGAFSAIKSRIWECINGWKEKFLSQAGKEVLLKAVIQAIPTYTMSVFQLPKTLCNDINAMMSKFWWGHKENENKIAWMSWKKLSMAKERGGMGYRDLESFNMALLAKQGWRLFQNPNSMVAKVLQEKYYPGGTFLDSRLGNRPSFAWRSIWNSKQLLNEGLLWRVGDGTSIRVWKDKWINVPSTYSIQSPVRLLHGDSTVSELIDVDTRWWKIDLIHEIFSKEEAEIICGIPICPVRQSDRRVWAGTKNGDFSVRSAYHLAREIYEAGRGSCSDSSVRIQQWKYIWSTRGPMVVKTFLWQACNEILPTRANLQKRGIITDLLLCPICGRSGETVAHILWNCPSAVDVWTECMKSIHKCSSADDSFLNIWMMLSRRLDAHEMQFVAVVARLIWLRRNKLIFDGVFQSPSMLYRMAQDQMAQFDEAESRRCAPRNEQIHTPVLLWKKPSFGVIKVNWDAAVDKEGQKMGIGIIARDHNGSIVAVLEASRKFITDPTTAEALAAWKMAELCVRMQLDNVVLEGDSLEVVQALNNKDCSWARYGTLINDAKLMLLCVQQWSIIHVRRQANGVAHRIAKMALSVSDDCEERLWTGDFPVYVRNCIS